MTNPKGETAVCRNVACGVSRRGFLKTAGATAAVAGLTGGLSQAFAADERADLGAVKGAEEQLFRGVCRPNCTAYCHLNVHVRDGKIMKTSRAPYSNDAYSRICLRGLSHPHRVYDPARLQYPMRRVEGTARGDMEWERITWDEAFTEIAERITQYQNQFGKQAFSYLTTSGNWSLVMMGMYKRLWNILQAGAVNNCLDLGSCFGMMRMTAGLQYWVCNEPADMLNAKAIVTWGSNMTDAQIHHWHFAKEAMQNGTKLVVIDPNYTTMASKADLWVPIRPGADMPLYMAIMYRVLQKDAVDEVFMKEHTVGPFLVRSDTGEFLRRSHAGTPAEDRGQVDPMTGAPIPYDPQYVVENGELVEYDKATNPDLDAEYEFEGVKCRTAFALLKDEIMKFPPEEASKICEVPVETIEELADICMDTPVFHYVGYGSQAYMNGVHTTHAGYTMCALLGNLGKPGASYGCNWQYYIGENVGFSAPTGANPTPPISQVEFADVMTSGKYLGKDFPIKMLYIYATNPLCTACDTNALLKAWEKLDFVVVADSVMTDTARFADMVLPIAQWFEVDDCTSGGATMCLNYNEKAIEPPYECKSDPDIARGIAEALGLGEYFQMSDEEALRELIDSEYSTATGVTFDRLKEDKEIRFTPDPYIAWEGGLFGTPTGRLEFYLEKPAPRFPTSKEITPELIERERLPHWFPPKEAWSESEESDKYPLSFLSRRPRFRVHSQWFSTPLLRELDPEPTIEINPVDAEPRGISDGDYVEAYNARGHAVAKAVINSAVRAGSVLYPKSWQMSQFKAGSWSELNDTDFDPFSVNSNFMDAHCEIRVWKEGDR